VGIYGIGEQEKNYKGKTSYVEQIIFTFELPSEPIEIDGEMKPRQLSRTFNASVSEKGHLGKFLKSWCGKGFTSKNELGNFEIFNLLGTSAMVNVIQTENGYSNIDTVMPLPKGMAVPSSDTALISFDVDEWDDDTYALLPGWIQEKVQNSSRYKEAHAPDTAVDFPEVSEDVEVTKAAETPAEGSRVERKGVAPF
jgi:hypothetical protein